MCMHACVFTGALNAPTGGLPVDPPPYTRNPHCNPPQFANFGLKSDEVPRAIVHGFFQYW